MEKGSNGGSKFLSPCESLHRATRVQTQKPWVIFTTKLFDSLTTNSINTKD